MVPTEALSQLHSYIMCTKCFGTPFQELDNPALSQKNHQEPSHLVPTEVLLHSSLQDIVELAFPCVILIMHSVDSIGSIAVECAYLIFVKDPPAHIPQ